MSKESPNKGKFFLTNEQIKEAALRHTTRSEFALHEGGAYQSARKRSILDEVCSHMKRKRKWTPENLRKEAMKYKTVGDFRKGCHSAYVIAHKHNLLDSVCAHMPTYTHKRRSRRPQ